MFWIQDTPFWEGKRGERGEAEFAELSLSYPILHDKSVKLREEAQVGA